MSAVFPTSARPDAPDRRLASSLDESKVLWGYLTNGSLVSLLCGPDGIVQWASPSAYAILGHPARALSGIDLTMLVDDANRPAIRARIQGISSPGTDADPICCQIHTGDDSRIWCNVEVVHLHESGEPQVLVTMRDASRQVAGARALRASEERFRAIVNEAPFGVGLQDRDGNFVFLNAGIGGVRPGVCGVLRPFAPVSG